jgi:type VI secretion system protein ImpK
MRTDFFDEAIVTSMLVASADKGEEAAQNGQNGEDLARADVLRERLALLMDRADRLAVYAGMPDELVEMADFAVCAFIDESLLSSSLWCGRADWLKKPLQFTRHGTATAGEDFYRRLDALLEMAEKKKPASPEPPTAQDAAGLPAHEDADAHDPLYAALEIFALCLAQGFTGMFHGAPAAIRDKLDAIGRFIPAVAHRSDPFFFAPAAKMKEQRLMRRATDLFRRFDPLDWILWFIPPALTALLYLVCEARLDQLLQPFLQGSTLP